MRLLLSDDADSPLGYDAYEVWSGDESATSDGEFDVECKWGQLNLQDERFKSLELQHATSSQGVDLSGPVEVSEGSADGHHSLGQSVGAIAQMLDTLPLSLRGVEVPNGFELRCADLSGPFRQPCPMCPRP